jgi:hypothetical protein
MGIALDPVLQAAVEPQASHCAMHDPTYMITIDRLNGLFSPSLRFTTGIDRMRPLGVKDLFKGGW